MKGIDIGNKEIVEAIQRTNEAYSRNHPEFDFDGKARPGYEVINQNGENKWLPKSDFENKYRPMSDEEKDFSLGENFMLRKKGCCMGARS